MTTWPRPRLVLHLGTQKTGSTSLQRSLRQGEALLARQGLRYASLERSGGAFKHVSVLRAARHHPGPAADREFRALQSELQALPPGGSLIVSEERLWRVDATPLAFFKRFQPAHEVVVVVFLRRQDRYVESLYNQMLRTGAPDESRLISAVWRDPDVAGRLDYHRLLSAWQAVADRVVALPFDAALQSRGVATSFLAALGVETERPLTEFGANPSPDGQAVLAVRWLRERGIAHSADVLMDLARRLPATRPPLRHFLGRRERQALLSSVERSNQALARDFHLQFDDHWPEEDDEPVVQPDPAYLAHLLGALSLAPAAPPPGKGPGAPSPRPT